MTIGRIGRKLVAFIIIGGAVGFMGHQLYKLQTATTYPEDWVESEGLPAAATRGVVLSPENVVLRQGDKGTLRIHTFGAPDPELAHPVEWIVADTSVAVVDEGVVTGKRTGETQVIASVGNSSDTASITVRSPGYDENRGSLDIGLNRCIDSLSTLDEQVDSLAVVNKYQEQTINNQRTSNSEKQSFPLWIHILIGIVSSACGNLLVDGRSNTESQQPQDDKKVGEDEEEEASEHVDTRAQDDDAAR